MCQKNCDSFAINRKLTMETNRLTALVFNIDSSLQTLLQHTQKKHHTDAVLVPKHFPLEGQN